MSASKEVAISPWRFCNSNGGTVFDKVGTRSLQSSKRTPPRPSPSREWPSRVEWLQILWDGADSEQELPLKVRERNRQISHMFM